MDNEGKQTNMYFSKVNSLAPPIPKLGKKPQCHKKKIKNR